MPGPSMGRRAFLGGMLAAGALPHVARATAAPAVDAAAGAAPFRRRGDIIGQLGVYRTRQEDTLIELARRFNLGYIELAVANPEVNPYVPGADVDLLLPTAHILPPGPREGIVINLAEQRLYYFPEGEDEQVFTFPIGIGQEDWATPLGETQVVRKKEGPTWTVPASIHAERKREGLEPYPAVVPPGPDNPLGSHALYLGWRAYLIHGTNQPFGVGRLVSHGCIRLYPEDIPNLFEMVPVGTPVRVIDQPVKAGWSDNEFYVEIHPTLAEAVVLEETEALPEAPALEARAVLEAVGPAAADLVDRGALDRALRRRAGVPVRMTPGTEEQVVADAAVLPRRAFLSMP
jgi:L,D-transpeptidase ErfK/SrfK